MKILHYMFGIPPVRGGGLIRYVTDLMQEQQKQGYIVNLLIPGYISRNIQKKINIKKKKNYANIPTFVINNSLPVPLGNGIKDIKWYIKSCDVSVYSEFLKKCSPDIIHIHSMMGLHLEFLQEATKKKIPIIFTTHDYFGICPITTRLRGKNICQETDWKQCAECCKNATSLNKLWLEQSRIYRLYRKNNYLSKLIHSKVIKVFFQELYTPELPKKVKFSIEKSEQKKYLNLQKYYQKMFGFVTYFHFISELAQQVYIEQLGKSCEGIVLSICHAGIKDNRTIRTPETKLRIGYLGGWQAFKGFNQLLDVIQKLYKKHEGQIELHIYSETQKINEPYIISHKNYDNKQLISVMCDFDLLVVPSQWQETFGFVVLEAISYGVPVLLSPNVGAKDLFKKNNIGFFYDGTSKDLLKVLEQIFQNREMLQQKSEEIKKWNYDFSFKNHVIEVGKIYKLFL